MEIISICNAYSQLIFLIQLKLTLFKSDNMAVILTDKTPGLEKISSNVKEIGIFSDVIFEKTKAICDGKLSTKHKIEQLINIVGRPQKEKWNFNPRYADLLLIYNQDYYSMVVCRMISQFNKKIRISRFEEGALSYNTNPRAGRRLIFCNKLVKLFGGKSVLFDLEELYCQHPQLYKGKLKTVLIPMIENKGELSSYLSRIFNITDVEKEYQEKYIFFTSVHDFEGGEPIGEYDLVCKIVALVGEDNLLIKTHPRDTRQIYKNIGVRVDHNSNIPWEAIQLAGDFSNKVFLTATSGSVLAGSFISEKPTTTFYLYGLCDVNNNIDAQRSITNIENLINDEQMKIILRNVHITNKLEEILE